MNTGYSKRKNRRDQVPALGFIEAIFEPDDWVEIRALYPKDLGKKSAEQRWTLAADFGEHLTWIEEQNAAGYGVYVGVNPRTQEGGASAKDVALARSVFVDLDGVTMDEAQHRLSETDLPAPSAAVKSGGGVHFYWKLDEPLTDMAKWRSIQERLIATLDSDKLVKDPPRVMRLPGFINTKPRRNGARAELIYAEPDREYALDEFEVEEDTSESAKRSPSADPLDHRPDLNGGDRATALEALRHLSPGRADGYDDWLTVGMAAHSVDTGEDMLGEWDRWSQQSGKYADGVCAGKWASFEQDHKSENGPITLATLIKMANEDCPDWRTCPEEHPTGSSTDPSCGTFPIEGSPSVSGVVGRSENWPDPEPLPDELPPVMPFDADLLPDSLRPWIIDIAERVQCPPEFPAVAAMVALASIVGRKVGIRPKRHDDWLVVVNLWGGVIGRPGVMKSPALQEALRPLHRLEIQAAGRFEEDQSDHKVAMVVARARQKEVEKEVAKAIRESRDADVIAEGVRDDVPEPPTRKRYVVNDSTVEKLGELLNENENGLLAFRDELIGLLRALDKDGQEGARAFYLEAWNGTGRFVYDRIGRGTIDIKACTLSVLGGIQPGILESYLRNAVKRGAGDDGLIQRFQMIVWPDVSHEWRSVDRWPERESRDAAYEVFDRLNMLNPQDVGAERDQFDPDGIPFLRFTPEAQEAFDEWRALLEHKVRSGEEDPAIESHLAKYRSLIPSLALVIHLADNGAGGPVGLSALERAIRWGTYLESHARRIYAVAASPDLFAAKALAKRIIAGDLKPEFALRDVYRPCWAGLASRDDAARAVEVLIDFGWLREVTERTKGAPRTRFLVNPRIYETPSGPTVKTAKSPEEPLSSVKSVPDQEELENRGPPDSNDSASTPDRRRTITHERIASLLREAQADYDRAPAS